MSEHTTRAPTPAPARIESYLCGRWVSGEGAGAPLHNPTTGEVVATASSAGLDLGAALAFARERGGPALRALTFAERGALLKAMSQAIHAEREALIELGRLNAGNTRGDAKFDIDGATHTLMHYAQLGESLGERRVLLDGEPEPVARGGRLSGQHILAPRHGVAVHINAFNFPAWGLAEKAACALLAGVPVLSKPATSTAWMTHALVRAVAPLLPEGALSLLCGGAGDLLSHLDWRDVVAFTGSADTGRVIRAHANVLAQGVQVNIEADSLNAALLDEAAEDATYDAFIRDVHREMTQKAGQKCTAARRVLVPRARLDEVVADLSERLGRSVVGDPALDEVTVGPLSAPSQRAAALEGLAALSADARVVFGGPEGPRVGVPDGVGAFINPTVLCAAGPLPATSAVHRVEVFGPVVTLIPYDSDEEAIAQARMGDGCLVTAIYGDRLELLEAAVLGLAAWSGRLVVVDAQVADKSLSPGLVTPQLLHGGPGRAGGGEELGGLRGLKLYQQRCAVQGNGPKLARLF